MFWHVWAVTLLCFVFNSHKSTNLLRILYATHLVGLQNIPSSCSCWGSLVIFCLFKRQKTCTTVIVFFTMPSGFVVTDSKKIQAGTPLSAQTTSTSHRPTDWNMWKSSIAQNCYRDTLTQQVSFSLTEMCHLSQRLKWTSWLKSKRRHHCPEGRLVKMLWLLGSTTPTLWLAPRPDT